LLAEPKDMPPEYLVIEKSQLAASIEAAARQLVAERAGGVVQEVLKHAVALPLPGGGPAPGSSPPPEPVAEGTAVGGEGRPPPIPQGMYRIGTGSEESSYADVVYHEIGAKVFDQYDAAKVVKT